MTYRILHGDCLERLREMPAESVHAVVTDPPAGISFMGKAWDNFGGRSNPKAQQDKEAWAARPDTYGRAFAHSSRPAAATKAERANFIAFMTEVMAECERVLMPGGHAVVWALPRTSHWTATAIEDAGFTIRDICTHIFAQGFPKSLDVSGAIKRCKCTPSAVQYTGNEEAHDALRCDDMRGLRQGVDAANAVPGRPQPDVFASVSREATVSSAEGRGAEAPALCDLRDVWQAIPVDEREEDGAVLLPQVQREGTGGTTTTPQTRLDRHQEPEEGQPDGKEPGVEGRRDVLQDARELYRCQVHPSAGVGEADGPQGRVHHGASPTDGPADRASALASGSGTSPRPQSGEQLPQQLGTVAQQPDAQDGGAWPLCDRCGLPKIPDGLGTALKPASEHWILARKPLRAANVATQVLETGTGALNVDGCRVDANGEKGINTRATARKDTTNWRMQGLQTEDRSGRWPTHLVTSCHPDCRKRGARRVRGTAPPGLPTVGAPRQIGTSTDIHGTKSGVHYADPDGTELVEDIEHVEGCPCLELDRQSGAQKSGTAVQRNGGGQRIWNAPNTMGAREDAGYGDSGGASRFFPRLDWEPGEYEQAVAYAFLSAYNGGVETGGQPWEQSGQEPTEGDNTLAGRKTASRSDNSSTDGSGSKQTALSQTDTKSTTSTTIHSTTTSTTSNSLPLSGTTTTTSDSERTTEPNQTAASPAAVPDAESTSHSLTSQSGEQEPITDTASPVSRHTPASGSSETANTTSPTASAGESRGSAPSRFYPRLDWEPGEYEAAFKFCPKPSRAERNAGLYDLPTGGGDGVVISNSHPT